MFGIVAGAVVVFFESVLILHFRSIVNFRCVHHIVAFALVHVSRCHLVAKLRCHDNEGQARVKVG